MKLSADSEQRALAQRLTLAAISGTFASIPPELLTAENMRLRGPDGLSVLYVACKTGAVVRLPRAAVSLTGLLESLPAARNQTAFHALVDSRSFSRLQVPVPEHAFLIPDNDGVTPLHLMTLRGDIDLVPLSIRMNEDYMTRTAASGNTPLQYVAANKQLPKLPDQRIINRANVTHRNKVGRTCLHALGVNGGFQQLPAELLTRQLLSIKDVKGKTPIDLAIQYGHEDTLPPGILPRKTADIGIS